jgi:conjugal transfer pilin signal peptidase TrbI
MENREAIKMKKIAFPFKDYPMKYKVIFIVTTGILLALVLQTNLTLNKSSSLPYKAFLCVKTLQPGRGDFALIEGHPTAYFGTITYVKEVSGLPGDQICIKENYLKVASTPIGKLKATTKRGQELHPLEDRTIPQDYVFVRASHPDSFDSRYQEFGLVRKSHLTARCFGLGFGDIHKSEASL